MLRKRSIAMKKIALILAALLLCLSIVSAGAENMSLLLPSTDNSYIDMVSACTVGDSAYFLAVDSGIACLYRWQPGMEKEEVMIADVDLATNLLNMSETEISEFGADSQTERIRAFSILFSDGERLLNLDIFSGQVFSVALENNEQVYTDVVTLQSTDLFLHKSEDYVYFPGVSGIACAGGKLIVHIQDWTDDGSEDTRLVVVDLTTGEVTRSSIPFVKALCSGPDGQAVIVTRDDVTAWHDDGTMDMPVVSLYDPAADTTRPVGEMSIDYLYGAVGYSAQYNAMMYVYNNRIMGYSLSDGTAKQYGFVIDSGYSRCNLLTLADSLIIPGWSGALVRTISGDFSSDRYLNMYAAWGDEGRALFSKRNPDIPVYDSEAYFDSIEALNQAMVAGEDALDILCMDVSYSSFLTMRDKGYCADLSGYPDLVAAVERMYPQFKEIVTAKDGTLRAIPVSANSYGWYVNTLVMEQMELTMDDIPTNFVDLCSFISDFNDNRADDLDEVTLFPYFSNVKEYLFSLALDDYMGWCMAHGRDITFNTPEFRAVMTAIEGLHTDRLKYSDWEHDVYYSGLFEVGNAVVGYFGIDPTYRLLPLTLTSDTDFVTGVDLRVMFVNPRSKNLDLAMEMLQCELEGMPATNQHTLFTDVIEPVENPYYEQNLQMERDYLEQLRETLANADESEKQEIQVMIDNAQSFIDRYADTWRYDISPENIDHYLNHLVPCMYVAEPTFLRTPDEASSEMTSLVNRYTDGQISLDQFIREMDNKMFMIRMENN